MKTFTKQRSMRSLKAICKKRGWGIYTGEYDKGSDHIVIDWCHYQYHGQMFVSMFNGKFFGVKAPNERFSSDETKHDDEAWFNELLETVYV